MAHAVPARARPQETMRALSRCVEDALVLQGVRGDADAVVPLLLAALERD